MRTQINFSLPANFFLLPRHCELFFCASAIFLSLALIHTFPHLEMAVVNFAVASDCSTDRQRLSYSQHNTANLYKDRYAVVEQEMVIEFAIGDFEAQLVVEVESPRVDNNLTSCISSCRVSWVGSILADNTADNTVLDD